MLTSTPPDIIGCSPGDLVINKDSTSESEIETKLENPLLSEGFIPVEFKFPSNIAVWSLT